jgi:holo-[acyl-carrier protein] synthase
MGSVVSTMKTQSTHTSGAEAFDLQRLALGACADPSLADNGCRVGVDIVHVHDVADSIERFGERYLSRLFTEQELASCQGTPAVVANGLAARFAAKEAAVKVLRPTGAQPEWRSMEVVKQQSGACDLIFHGAAAELAGESGLHSPAVSLSHEGDFAIAVVIAMTSDISQDPRQNSAPRDVTQQRHLSDGA